jgi:hypothetical protein
LRSDSSGSGVVRRRRRWRSDGNGPREGAVRPAANQGGSGRRPSMDSDGLALEGTMRRRAEKRRSMPPSTETRDGVWVRDAGWRARQSVSRERASRYLFRQQALEETGEGAGVRLSWRFPRKGSQFVCACYERWTGVDGGASARPCRSSTSTAAGILRTKRGESSSAGHLGNSGQYHEDLVVG